MNNDEKILKALETLQAGQTQLTAKIDSVEIKVEAFNHKLDATTKEIKEEIKETKEEIKETIERETETSTELFNHTFEKLDKQEKLEKRIARIEKRLDL